jgi:hypothetical protein
MALDVSSLLLLLLLLLTAVVCQPRSAAAGM